MKTSEKLIARLNKELNLEIPLDEKPRRLYHGYNQRSIGAWSWCIGGNRTMVKSIGSQWNMKQLLKEKKLDTFTEVVGDISIIPA